MPTEQGEDETHSLLVLSRNMRRVHEVRERYFIRSSHDSLAPFSGLRRIVRLQDSHESEQVSHFQSEIRYLPFMIHLPCIRYEVMVFVSKKSRMEVYISEKRATERIRSTR